MWNINSVLLQNSQAKILEKIAEESHPYEGCALMLGNIKKDIVEITDILPANNQAKSETIFEIDPQKVYEAYQAADREKKEFVGVFHSHPAPPQPSALDIQFMKINPVVWIILSTLSKTFEAYQFYDESVKSLALILNNSE